MVMVEQQEYLCEEEKRLKEDRERSRYWKKWFVILSFGLIGLRALQRQYL